MKKFVICETVNHYHMVEVDDEIDIEKVVADAKALIKMSSGVEALAAINARAISRTSLSRLYMKTVGL